jgi:Ala-tRNA(Pro) deacylase
MYTTDFLRSLGVWFEPLLHSPASSAAKRARNVHVPGRRVAKTVLVKAGDRLVLVVLSSTSRIDLRRLSDMMGLPARDIRLATTHELGRVFTDCEPGAVPPFGRLYDLGTVFDSTLTDVTELVFGGNTRHEGLRMRSRDYIAIEEPVIGPFAVPIASGPVADVDVPLLKKHAGFLALLRQGSHEKGTISPEERRQEMVF